VDTTLISAKPQHKHRLSAINHTHFEAVAPELARWQQRNRYYYRDIERLHQFLIPAGARVLEIGCGLGDLLHGVAPQVGVGIDFSTEVAALAQARHPHLHIYCLDAETLTPADLAPEHQQFDYIMLAGVLGYLSDVQAVLQRLQPLCHSRTRVILTFHNYMWEPLLRLAEKVGQRRPQPPKAGSRWMMWSICCPSLGSPP
jgi:2-polyprenyl-3-methyl-5-hydroxy-6-metoxy-1,4-benzoquinol methylase